MGQKLRFITNTLSEVEYACFTRLVGDGLVDLVYIVGNQSNGGDTLTQKSGVEGPCFWELVESALGVDREGVDLSELTPELYEGVKWAEVMTMDMMDRIDVTKSMLYHERRSLFEYLVCYWSRIVRECRPDIFYSRVMPHEVVDFVLYAVCQYYEVRVFMFMPVSLFGFGYQFSVCDYRWPWRSLSEALNSPYQVCGDARECSLSEDLREWIGSYRCHYVRPDYLEIQLARDDLKLRSNWSGAISLSHKIKLFIRFVLALSRCTDLGAGFYREVRRLLGSYSSSYVFSCLMDHYDSVAILPDRPRKYVYFLLHFQPELATSPLGGFFDKQMRAISLIARNMPEGWAVYVKEHPAQFMRKGYYGYLGRDLAFYEKIRSLPNVFFVPRNVDHFAFLDGSSCVATITGTAGWEAIARGKPALIFGEAWYQDAPGVFRIKSTEDIQAFFYALCNEQVSIFDDDILRFLRALRQVSFDVVYSEEEAAYAGRDFDLTENADKLYYEVARYIDSIGGSKLLNI